MTESIERRWSLIAASTLALAACAPQPSGPSSIDAPQFASSQVNQSSAGRREAVTHTFSLRLPSNEVEAAQQKHLAECRKLGCTILNTQFDRSNEGRVNARCSIRIAPDAYQAFAAIIQTPPVEVVTHAESADDQTVPMLDVEKRLEVKLALRDRLTAMLRDPGAKSTADLIAIEKELAQVQGDIESATAQHDQLKTITETVRVDIAYSGRAAVVAGMIFLPSGRPSSGRAEPPYRRSQP